MAAALVGGAFLTSFVNVLFDRLSSPEVVNWVKAKKLDEKLCRRLKRTLTVVRVVLNDAEQKQITDPAVKEWLADLEDAVYNADDLLDEVSTKAVTQKHAGNILTRYFNSSQDREMVSKIEEVIDTLEEIEKHKDILGLKEIATVNMSRRTPTTSLVEKSEIYGRDEDKDAIIKLLLNDTCDARVSVIPIVGMGGVGKTTLAQLVYNDDELKGKFDYKAWVCVGEESDIVKVTKAVIVAITSCSCDENDFNLLQIGLKEKLSGKKILVVLDDVWNNDFDDWKILLKPFQYGNKGSKILVTTRNEKFAFVMPTIPPYKLSLLSIEDCWSIFLKYSFLSHESREYSALEQIGRKIVEKCKGLPLAVETLGGLLRTNYAVKYWDNILQNEIWKFLEDKSGIIPALRISYHYLPSHLKRCFVCCSLYPKDYEFDKDDLILLWMAENFLQPNGIMTFEEIGCEYFNELVARSFFQSPSATEGSFVMHDLIHDLATVCAGEFYFRVEELENPPEIRIKTRHLSLNARRSKPISEVVGVCDRAKHIRTLLVTRLVKANQFNMESAPYIFVSQFKYLRALSFAYSPLESLPHSIGELIHLRYLDLSRTPILTLPESLRNLYNLQTLKLFHCYWIEMLPIGMQDLVNLRHLDIRGTSLREMPKGMSKLKHLQFLSDFVVGKHEENGISELGALANLHGSLCIDKSENVSSSDEALKARMADKKHITDLTLRWSLDASFLDSQVERDVLDKLQPHKELINLEIKGYRGTKFPDWLGHSSYRNMTGLNLNSCRNCYRLPSLGQLPSLKALVISRFDGVEIIGDDEFYWIDESCSATPFPSLEFLKFDGMCCWREWRSLKLNVFSRLKELTIDDCPLLRGDLPSHLPALEKLSIVGCKQLACSLPRAPAILKIEIAGCDVLRIQEIPLSLRSLSIEGTQLVESAFEAMTRTLPTCLRELDIANCSSPMSFPGDSIPASLEIMYIKNCPKLEFPMHQEHESLQWINISGSCDSLTSFHLESFPHLTKLIICKCASVKSLVISETTYLSSLESLSIFECDNFMSFSRLGTNAPKLEDLRISACPEIDSFPDGVLPPNLWSLRIWECDKLVRCLTSMDLHSHGLTYLEIKGPCEGVNAFPKEGWLPASLESLLLWGFESLETLDCRGFLHLTSFRRFIITNCPKLENIVGERFPSSLTELSIWSSPLLGERCKKKDPQIWLKISCISSIEVDDEQIH